MICHSYSSHLILPTVRSLIRFSTFFPLIFFILFFYSFFWRYLAETLKIYLKDVGANLVANLSLLSEFSNAASKVADWWSLVKDGLALEEASSLLLPFNNDTESEMFAWWSEMKDNFQEYYDVVKFFCFFDNRKIILLIISLSFSFLSRSMLYISDFPNYSHHQA